MGFICFRRRSRGAGKGFAVKATRCGDFVDGILCREQNTTRALISKRRGSGLLKKRDFFNKQKHREGNLGVSVTNKSVRKEKS